MKGISIIVILSIVWSIISAIIEKRKAAEKKAGLKQTQKQPPKQPPIQASLKTKEVFKADPTQVKIERLRRRKRPTKPQAVVQQQVTVAPKQARPKRSPLQTPPIQPVQNEPLIERITPLNHDESDFNPIKQTLKRTSKPANQLSQMLKKRKNLKTAIVLSEVLGKPIAKRA